MYPVYSVTYLSGRSRLRKCGGSAETAAALLRPPEVEAGPVGPRRLMEDRQLLADQVGQGEGRRRRDDGDVGRAQRAFKDGARLDQRGRRVAAVARRDGQHVLAPVGEDAEPVRQPADEAGNRPRRRAFLRRRADEPDLRAYLFPVPGDPDFGRPRAVRRVPVGLAGKDPVCHCAPRPCHAQVLARAAKWERERQNAQ